MSEPPRELSSEEICAQAQTNASAGTLMVLVLARERGQPLADAARFIGQAFATSWDEIQGAGALDTVRTTTLNAVTCGAELRRLDGDDQRAEAVIAGVAGWPNEEELSYFGLSQDEADTLNWLYVPVAERLGLRYAWRRDGDAIVMTFEAATT
jgi:hypothetical protein